MKRDAFTEPLDLGHEGLADNFAGGGGASTAIAMAFGREPDIAINHDGEALCMHAANHPTTHHIREDVFLIDPAKVTRNNPVGMVWFSPTCTHFSKAKGDNILNQKMRGLAWVVFKWCAYVVPRTMFLENVEEFITWGPLDSKGKPIKEFSGRTFRAFIDVLTTGIAPDHPDLQEIMETLGDAFPCSLLLRGFGYTVEWRNLFAHHFGAGTRRKRLYMVMRRDGLPICWPERTHGPADSQEVRSGKWLPEDITGNNIDWSIPCKSILFGRKKDLVPPTLRRIGRGFELFVKDTDNPYIVNDKIAAAVVQTGYGEAPGQKPRVMDIRQPLTTVVAGGGKHAVMAAHITKFKTGSTGHRLDEPLATITSGGGAKRPAGAAHGLGLVAASLIQYYSGGGQNSGVDQPLPTIVTKGRMGLTCTTLQAAHLVGIDNQSNKSGSWSAADPLTTITTENRHAVVVSNLVKLRGTSHAAAANEPLGTISAGGLHHGEVRTTLAEAEHEADAEYLTRRQKIREFLWEYCPSLEGVDRPELVMIRGVLMEVTDIGLRMLTPRELANCQGFPRDYILDPYHTYTNKRGKTVTKRLPQHAQVRMIGNSVSPPPAVALMRANIQHEVMMARAA
jgi:DNA (cytosine-5)-methyltransferase 1